MKKLSPLLFTTIVTLLSACGGGSDSKTQDDSSDTTSEGGGNSGGSTTTKYDPYSGTGDGNYRLKAKLFKNSNQKLIFEYKSAGTHTKVSKVIESGHNFEVSEFNYHADGSLAEEITTKYNDDHTIKSKQTTRYTFSGQISLLTYRKNAIKYANTKGTGCEPIGGISTTIDSVVSYNEDRDGNAISVSSIQDTGTYAGIKSNGSCFTSSGNMLRAFSYDTRGRMSKFTWTTTAGDLWLDKNYTYDNADRLIKEIGEFFGVKSKTEYTYNSDGVMDTIKEYDYASDGKWMLMNDIVLEYEEGQCFNQYPIASGFVMSHLTMCVHK